MNKHAKNLLNNNFDYENWENKGYAFVNLTSPYMLYYFMNFLIINVGYILSRKKYVN